MKKDPAFLFYSQDFYGGTRTMLPEERACHLDLMIYQHQNGLIPLDTRRVLMFCSGISEATLKAVLEAKYIKTESGYYSEKLRSVILERSDYKNKKSESGAIGQFYKKLKSKVTASKYIDLKAVIQKNYTNKSLLELIKNKKTIEATLIALLKHIEDEDEIEIENKDKEENKIENKGDRKIEIINISNSYRPDLFEVDLINFIKKINPGYRISASEKKFVEEIWIKCEGMFEVQKMVMTSENVIGSFEWLFEKSQFYKNHMKGVKSFASNFDAIVASVATPYKPKNKNGIDKDDYDSGIRALAEKYKKESENE